MAKNNKIRISFLGENSSVTSLPSALKNFPLSSTNWRLWLNQVGIYQYMAKRAAPPRSQINILSINRTRDNTAINSIPVIAERRITFRSLLKNFVIKVLYYLGCHGIIIAQKSLQVILFLGMVLGYANPSIALAKDECLLAISKYEQLYKIPKGLLKAVSKVESEYNPLALNDGLKQHNFKTRNEVINRVNYLLEIGKTNFDIGCMQINYYWHGKNFTSVEEILDVSGNVRYAASLIYGLYKEHGTWQAAVRHYHSYEPSIHKKYSKKVAYAWLKEGI